MGVQYSALKTQSDSYANTMFKARSNALSVKGELIALRELENKQAAAFQMTIHHRKKSLPPVFVMLKTLSAYHHIKRLVTHELVTARDNIHVRTLTDVDASVVAVRKKLPIISVNVKASDIKHARAEKILRIGRFDRLNEKTLF